MSQELQDKEKIDAVFNRLRARLFSMIEQIGLDDKQYKAYKQTVKDITSDAWNSVVAIIVKKREE